MKHGVWTIATGLLAACGGGTSAETSSTAPSSGDEQVVIEEDDDPRVSASAGEEGGIVVLWPRVIGLAEGDEAAGVQSHLVALARRSFPDHRLDVRPDPERVCPRTGCLGPSFGALLVVQNGQCAVVGIVGRPAQGNLTLVPWAGELDVRDRNIAFRDPPESHVTLRDRVDCGTLEQELAAHDADVEAALRDVVPRMAL